MSFSSCATSLTEGPSQDAFRCRMDNALKVVAKVLSAERVPRHPADVSHTYADKFLIAELSTRSAVASLDMVLRRVCTHTPWDSTATDLRRAVQSAMAVTMRFAATTKCAFKESKTRKVDSDVEHVRTGPFGGRSKTVTTIHEHFWDIDATWELSVYTGTDVDGRVVLARGHCAHVTKTTGSEPSMPMPKHQEHPPSEVSMDWLLKHTTDDGVSFDIDRGVPSCWTPRRNQDVDQALVFFRRFEQFLECVTHHVRSKLWKLQLQHSYDLSPISDTGLFNPIMAMCALEKKSGAPAASLSPSDLALLMKEEERTLTGRLEQLERALPGEDSGQLITAASARLAVLCLHAGALCDGHRVAVAAVEDMLRKQLIAAIGKEVGPDDFAEYMDFHNRRLFQEPYRPKPFSYAVRRPDHFPEGAVSIEVAESPHSGDSKPINTFVASSRATTPMTFPLSASADLYFYGERHLHACLMHRFSGQSGPFLRLCARARQFSSFILLVGKISAKDAFAPSAALIIQNKDDLVLPLLLETLPTPKEFRDAVESLSPEQRAFAKAYRSMQLASTVFGVLVIQIKPQLERLLNLAPDALTKEVALTQDLMEMFIKYQLPSDLIKFDGPESTSGKDRLAAVKEHVKSLRRVTAAFREKELREEEEAARMRGPRQTGLHVPPSPTSTPTSVPPGTGVQFFSDDDSDCCTFLCCSAASAASARHHARVDVDGGGAPCLMAMESSQTQQQQSGELSVPGRAAEPQQFQQPQRGLPGHGSPAPRSVDYTAIPRLLDGQFEALDEDAAVRPTIIKPVEGMWTKKSQAGLLSDAVSNSLYEAEQRTEKDRAFDLLDALSRSGSLPVEDASLHVVLAATHCFEETLMNTVVRRNLNPIEKTERSCLIMSSVVRGMPASELIEEQHEARVREHSSRLFLQDAS
eukprot:TRINITY_DN921_c0_g1_i3.p1 TRINITY_DN921_c0_g1~~TRINITY_DN921_c0_g1_i3.p1  ORF type:complete len:921 (+),score=161.47 TRINITY_DN921_c0_g1_i3:64-2826(+)